jgi:hypothetical protein
MDERDVDRMSRTAVAQARAMFGRMVQGWCQDYLVFRAGFDWSVRAERPLTALQAAGAQED